MKNLIKNLLLISLLCLGRTMAFSQTFPVFIDMPGLSKSESKMLKSGILSYLQTYPDSIHSGIYDNLKQISQFIEATPDSSLAEIYILNIPLKVINFIENQYYSGSIQGWSQENDMDTRNIEMHSTMMKHYTNEVNRAKESIKNKMSFRCKYFKLMGLPCN